MLDEMPGKGDSILGARRVRSNAKQRRNQCMQRARHHEMLDRMSNEGAPPAMEMESVLLDRWTALQSGEVYIPSGCCQLPMCIISHEPVFIICQTGKSIKR